MKMTARQLATTAWIGLLSAGLPGCGPPSLDAIDEAPAVGALAGSFSCPVARGPAYDLGPASFTGDLGLDGVREGLRTQGCVAQVVETTRGDAIQVRAIQHSGFQRGQVLELHFPLDALVDDDLFVEGALVFVGRGGFGSLLTVDGDTTDVLARTVGGSVELDAWGTEPGDVVTGRFSQLRMGEP